jgi:hypothetical protein
MRRKWHDYAARTMRTSQEAVNVNWIKLADDIWTTVFAASWELSLVDAAVQPIPPEGNLAKPIHPRHVSLHFLRAAPFLVAWRFFITSCLFMAPSATLECPVLTSARCSIGANGPELKAPSPRGSQVRRPVPVGCAELIAVRQRSYQANIPNFSEQL